MTEFFMRQKTRILIPTILTAIAIIYCWIMLLINNYIPSWKHYTALAIFVVIVLGSLKRLKNLMLLLGPYLLLASLHVISLSYNQSVFGFGSVDSEYTPKLQFMSLGLFIVYFILNLDGLIEWDLDRKERKEKSNQA